MDVSGRSQATGTFLDDKLHFDSNTDAISKKANQHCFCLRELLSFFMICLNRLQHLYQLRVSNEVGSAAQKLQLLSPLHSNPDKKHDVSLNAGVT